MNLAQESHSGEYSCVAENSAGVAKMILDVDVYVPPQFVKNFNTDVELFEHGSAIVTCDASGSPPPSVIWQRSGRLLKGNGSPRQEGAQERKKIRKIIIFFLMESPHDLKNNGF